MRKLLIFLVTLVLEGFCFSLLELGTPIESLLNQQHRESFLINEVADIDKLVVQLNLRYGKVQFGVDIFNSTRDYMNADLDYYRWHSNSFAPKDGHDIMENQIRIDLVSLRQQISNSKVSKKLQKIARRQSFIVTIEAELSSKYSLVALSDRLFLKANNSMEFVLPKQNDSISFVIEAKNFFLFNALIKTGEAHMKINRLFEELAIPDTSTAISHQQQIAIPNLIKDSDEMLDQIVNNKEALQIGNTRSGIMQYIVTVKNTQEVPINISIYWTSMMGTAIKYKYDTFYGMIYGFFFGDNLKSGKFMVKILIMALIVTSFLLYAVVFIFKSIGKRKQYEQLKFYDEEDLQDNQL